MAQSGASEGVGENQSVLSPVREVEEDIPGDVYVKFNYINIK